MTPLDRPVPPVPHATRGVAWLRSHVARFSDGDDHVRRRALAVGLLARIDPEALRRTARREGGHPVSALATALGVSADPEDVAAVAASYHPHTTITAEADAAVDRLVAACGGVADERAAALLGLLVQACDATAALVRSARAAGSIEAALAHDPPVRHTRRGTDLIDLAGLPFGAGAHECPGRAHALAITAGLLGRTS
ncbi:hypothetical protein [Umezawaea beigongshangensis]|uniref:hypothetical protein n=1 Tax=Umezawaea beigongshangensis TaxID=2780383 RepID=UPI0018F1DF19|nr:hypothetical protein [Umezawaea beigongshangensis]